MKVRIDRDREGWRYYIGKPDEPGYVMSSPVSTYYDAKRLAVAAGHEVDNAGWLHRLLMWNFNNLALDGYTGWEIVNPAAGKYERHPAFVKLEHRHGKGDGNNSHDLCVEWDDHAEADFYQRDWTDDNIPFVRDGEVYWSGWWFQTLAERDRFLRYFGDRVRVSS